jgi:hypothetical protein
MNGPLIDLYNQFLAQTGEPAAAAMLVLAQVQAGQQAGGVIASRDQPDAACDSLLRLNEAAEYLGYNPAGLRKIVNQQKIQFVQNGRGPIKFRREWLDDFIGANVSGPQDIERSPAQPRTAMPSIEPRFGFDPRLFKSNIPARWQKRAA